MLSLQQQHGGAVAAGGDARHHAPQPAVLGGGGGGGGGDWLGFLGRGELEDPPRNAPSPALFLLPPAPLDDRAVQPESKPKPGQLAGGDSSCKCFASLYSLVTVRVWGIRVCVLRSTGSPLSQCIRFGEMNTLLVPLRRFDGVVFLFLFSKWRNIYNFSVYSN
jgi:hypothetical protein